jgi:hypothetical protein
MRSPRLPYVSPITLWICEPIFMKLGMYIVPPEPISTAYLMNSVRQSMCRYVYVLVVAR